MNFTYTRLAILLLRIKGVILVAESIPGIFMWISFLFSSSRMAVPTELGVPNYGISVLFQTAIGVLLIVFSIPIASKFVGFLDQK